VRISTGRETCRSFCIMMLVKRTLLTLHRRVAVLFAFFLMVQALSGAAISWRWEVARFIDPAGMTASQSVERDNIEKVMGRAVAALPEASSTRIYFPTSPQSTYLLRLETEKGTWYASVDPANGALLRQGTVWHFPLEAALQLHFQPLQGRPGNSLVLALALALITVGVTGFLFLRPRQGRWRKQLAIDFRSSGKNLLRQLHRTLGIFVLPLLLTIAVTGALLALEILLSPPASSAKKPDYVTTNFAGFACALKAAKQAFPETRIRDVRISGDVVRIQLHEPDNAPWAIHRVTAAMQAPCVIESQPASVRRAWWPQLLPIHTGSLLGTAGRILVTGVAAVLLLLTLMGFWLWLTRSRQYHR